MRWLLNALIFLKPWKCGSWIENSFEYRKESLHRNEPITSTAHNSQICVGHMDNRKILLKCLVPAERKKHPG